MQWCHTAQNPERRCEKSKTRLLTEIIYRKIWCGRVDSNHHGIATASPSSWCVCQFRHDRTEVKDTF
jgi:hypothetical protein